MTYTYFDKSKWKYDGGGERGGYAYLPRTPGLILGFRVLNRPRISGIHVSFWILELPYAALFNGLMFSDIRILVLQFFCLQILNLSDLDHGQRMTLTFGTHNASCTHLVDCIFPL